MIRAKKSARLKAGAAFLARLDAEIAAALLALSGNEAAHAAARWTPLNERRKRKQ